MDEHYETDVFTDSTIKGKLGVNAMKAKKHLYDHIVYDSMSSMQLRFIEESKIHCAREHFKAISSGDVVYDVVDSYKSLLDIVKK